MDIGFGIGELQRSTSPQQRREVQQMALSLAAERFASSQATTLANRTTYQPHVVQDSFELSEHAAEAISGSDDFTSLKRTDQLVTALQNAWSGGGHEPTRRDQRGGRR